jgi:hypothetical protein
MACTPKSNKKVTMPARYEMDLDTIGPAAVVAKLCKVIGPDGVHMAAKTEGSEIYEYAEKYIEAGIMNYEICCGFDRSDAAMVFKNAVGKPQGRYMCGRGSCH